MNGFNEEFDNGTRKLKSFESRQFQSTSTKFSDWVTVLSDVGRQLNRNFNADSYAKLKMINPQTVNFGVYWPDTWFEKPNDTFGIHQNRLPDYPMHEIM